jgi:hypothetical protein
MPALGRPEQQLLQTTSCLVQGPMHWWIPVPRSQETVLSTVEKSKLDEVNGT